MKSFVILGAGLPHDGSQHSVLSHAIGQHSVLDWLLHACRNIDATPIFVGGYQLNEIEKKYPKLNTVNNPKWSESKATYSLFKGLPYVNDSTIVSYSDVLYRPALVQLVENSNDDITIVLDSSWRTRFSGRTREDQDLSEKVCFHLDGVKRLGVDISIEQANAEFVGLVKFSGKVVDYLKRHYARFMETHVQASLSYLIETLRIEGFEVGYVDVKGDWAELNQPEDLAHFILGTKAQTLQRLQSIVKLSRIEDQVSFTLGEWKLAPAAVIDKIKGKFNSGTVVIRSSAVSEDGFNESNAGAYTSLLNIPTDSTSLKNSISAVIASYPDQNSENQVLVQPMLQNVEASGVVFTRVLNTGAPYYFVNYDDITGSTESITGGTAKEHKTLLMRRDASLDSRNIPKKMRSLLPALRELESLLNYSALDIEFAITDSGLHILQVRPIAVAKHVEFDEDKFYETIEKAKQQFQINQIASPFVAQSKAIFGVMPDWNPAEIIGTKPTPLAASLYNHLIMDDIWAAQRAEYGYQDVRPHGLIVNFAGHPYVDIRASFTSFIPHGVSNKLRDKLVEFYIRWLEEHPHLHDKVEFDVVPTCYALDFERWEQRLLTEGRFKEEEISSLRQGLKSITLNAITRVELDLKDVDTLSQRYCSIVEAKLDQLTKASLLLDDCKNYGTLPFAHLARAGFVAVTLLKSAVTKDIISQSAFDDFMGSIRSVSHQLSEDAQNVKSGKLSWDEFFNTYAHLRPGTYDITSESYGANPEHYLRPLITEAPVQSERPIKNSWRQEVDRFVKALNVEGFDLDVGSIEKFLQQAIEGREYAKFMFSRNLSKALDLIQEWGKEHRLDVSELAYMEINELIKLRKDKQQISIDFLQSLKAIVEQRKAYHRLIKSIELPPLLCSEADFDVFQYPHSQANFVGSRTIMAECIDLSQEQPITKADALSGLIVMIPQADPGYDWLFGRNIAGLVTMYGGANSHMAIRAAEFDLPAAIGIGEGRYQELRVAKLLELNPTARQLKMIR